MKFWEVVKVTEVPIESEDLQYNPNLAFSSEIHTSIFDILAFMAHLPLKDQVYMLCNVLTVSGYSQKEVAEALGVPYQTYRNRLLEIRKDFKDKADRPF